MKHRSLSGSCGYAVMHSETQTLCTIIASAWYVKPRPVIIGGTVVAACVISAHLVDIAQTCNHRQQCIDYKAMHVCVHNSF